MRRAPVVVVILACACGLGGCLSGLFHSNARQTQVYVLRVPAIAGGSGAVAAVTRASLHVSRPMAGPGLDSEHIMLVQSDHRMSYYSDSRWPARLPEVLEALVVQTLRDGGAWTSVQGSGSVFPSDYILQIVVSRFEADYTQSADVPQVRVTLDCTVGSRQTREVIANFVADATAPAAANRLGEVVAAFEQATNEALAILAKRSSEAVANSAAR